MDTRFNFFRWYCWDNLFLFRKKENCLTSSKTIKAGLAAIKNESTSEFHNDLEQNSIARSKKIEKHEQTRLAFMGSFYQEQAGT